jgi:predicted ATPase
MKTSNSNAVLTVKNLAQIKSGSIEFADFTLLVGPQASGKSILPQLLKLIIDRQHITKTLNDNGYNINKDGSTLLELYFGEGMSKIWKTDTEVSYDKKNYTKTTAFLPKQGERDTTKQNPAVFYVPAQRVVTMSQGFPRNFGSFDIGDPFVLRTFSETLRVLIENETIGKEGFVFPQKGRFKKPIQKMIDDSIFHGASIEIDKRAMKKRFLLNIDNTQLPFMNWSAGQKEFMPLLLSLYNLIPSSKITKKENIEYVIIEEPEMGLHPKAIEALMVIFLELLHRGYKLIITTHSTVLLELAWTMSYIKNCGGTTNDLLQLFNLSKTEGVPLNPVFEQVITQKTFGTYYFQRQKDGVNIKNISTLDIEDDAENWGGLSAFATKASEIIAKLVSNGEI